jgi:hypothetical protein
MENLTWSSDIVWAKWRIELGLKSKLPWNYGKKLKVG